MTNGEEHQAVVPIESPASVYGVPELSESIEGVFPLTGQQQGMLYNWLQDRHSGLDILQLAVTLDGIDIAAFRRAWQAMVQRHQILRMRFRWQDVDEPVQEIAHDLTLEFEEADWSALSPAAQDDKLEEWLATDRRNGFDLGALRLAHFGYFRIGESQHVFTMSMPHILLDGRSYVTMFGEVFEVYNAESEGRGSKLPDVRPYSDYLAWLQGCDHAPALEYWGAILSGFSSPVFPEVGTDGEAVGTPDHTEQRVTLTREQTERLTAFSVAHKLTPSIMVHAAWALLLARYAGTDDVVYGVTRAARRAALDGDKSANRMAGIFINTLPERVCIRDDQRVIDWLHELRHNQTEARPHEQVPLPMVQSLTEVPLGTPLFETLVIFENRLESRVLERVDSRLSRLRVREQTSVPITLHAYAEKEMLLRIEYDRVRIRDGAVRRMLPQLAHLLMALVDHGDGRLGEIELITPEERSVLLERWNNTAADFPRDVCAHQWIEQTAARHADRVAVEDTAGAMTYAELDTAANRLAHHLIACGVTPGSLVAICLERSRDLVVSMLAVWKTGAAYVPLDPDYPAGRIADIVEDSRPGVIVSHRDLAERVPGGTANIVFLDEEQARIASASGAAPNVRVRSDDLAYVIFTSGSTGRPKGVELRHRGLVNFLNSMRKAPGITESDALLAVTTVSFDIAALELFLPLVSGARVMIASRNVAIDGHALAERIASTRATMMQATPVSWRMLLDAGWTNPSRIRMLCGGEALPSSLAAELNATGAELWNMYGPTETTIWSSVDRVDDARSGAIVPVGPPIDNTTFYVLDAKLRPVPVGVAGELLIGGEGVARGYLGRDDLTAERFVANPFESGTDAKLYRTGDLVRYRSDGRLEFLGRMDHQIKLRGYRIELGEIESALTRQPEVHSAIVVVRDDAGSEPQLVAYCISAAGTPPANKRSADILAAVATSLPAYMVPSVIVWLDTWPLTSNGKIDRKRLPAPERNAAESRRAFVAPNTADERALAELWSEVLKREHIGAHDDFFELGGHSLLATRLLNRIRRAFGVDVSLRDLFAAPTLSELAATLSDRRKAGGVTLARQIRAVQREGIIPLSYVQQRFWFLEQVAPSAVYNIPLAWSFDGALDADALRGALNGVIARHESLRTRFVAVEGWPQQMIEDALVLDLPSESVDGENGDARASRIYEDMARASFDLAAGPLIRARLLRLSPTRHVLIVIVHHIVFDGWSTNIFCDDLARFYAAFSTGDHAPVSALPVQYADFATWQRETMTDAVMEEQLAYWRKQLTGAPAALELLADRPRPAVQSNSGAKVPVLIDAPLFASLQALAQRQDVTVYMVLMAALYALLYRYSGQDDVVIGTPIANRNQRETESLIGSFVNILALRARIASEAPFSALLAQVRENTLGAYANQDVPFERLVETINPQRDPSRTAFFQVFLAFQSAGENPVPRLPGIAADVLAPPDAGVSRYDMTFFIDETERDIRGVLEYNTDLFDEDSAARFTQHYLNVLRDVARNPGAQVCELNVLSSGETARLLHEWNATSADAPADRCTHNWIERTARSHPSRIAIEDERGLFTYAELDAAANRLARHLRERGVTRGTLVAVSVERTRNLLVSVLATWKAGAAYVPLDPEYPAARISQIIEDAAPAVFLTESAFLDRLPDIPTALVQLDAHRAAIDAHEDTPLDVSSDPSDLAYVIFTSGSTGRPKGVQIEHGNLVNLLNSMRVRPGFQDTDVLLAITTVSFDLAVPDLYLPLIVGGRMVIAPRETAINGPALAALIERANVTIMQATPVTWQILLECGWTNPRRMKMLCGGEAVSIPLAERLTATGGELWNMYGPTETTVWSAADRATTDDAFGVLPIGGPLDNTRLFVLDEHMQPVPIGVAGELHIGGAGVARGYLNKPEMTSQKFVTDPFDARRGRVYKTGDRVRYRPDGRLQFLGRTDHQVKVRGYRIELGEIEAALREHESVDDAVVIALDDGVGMKRLVAYVQAENVAGVEWNRFLGSRLPHYMVPAVVIPLARLPLTVNGKIDRAALPAPDTELTRSESLGPRDEIEARVLRIWHEILGNKNIGVTDRFNDVGGHSLAAVRVFTRINADFARSIPLATILRRDTVAALAEILRAPETADEWQCIVRFPSATSGQPIFCVHAAMGNVLIYERFAQRLGTDHPVYGIQAVGNFGSQLPHETVEEMVAYYAAEVFKVQPTGPYVFFGLSQGGMLALALAHYMRSHGHEVKLVVMYDTSGPGYPRLTMAGRVHRYLTEHGDITLRRLWLMFAVGTVPLREWRSLYWKIRERAYETRDWWRGELQRNRLLRRFRHQNPPLDFPLPPNVSRVFLAHHRVSERYTPPFWPGRITYIRAEQAFAGTVPDDLRGWGGRAADIEIHNLPGGHNEGMWEPGVDDLARLFRKFLEPSSE